jgi:hypothetical protein
MNDDIAREVVTLRMATTGQVCERYAELFGEKDRSRHKVYLIRRIAWRLQALAEGDLSERARRRAEELADDAEVRVALLQRVDPAGRADAPLDGPDLAKDSRGPVCPLDQQ